MRQLRLMTTWAAALSLVFALGCDNNDGTDAGPVGVDAGGDVDGGGGMVDSGPGTDSGPGGDDAGPPGMCTGPMGACDVTNASSCGAGMACLISGSSMTMWETACTGAGVGTQGSACDPTMPNVCAEGYQCDSSAMVCQRFCCTTGDCETGDFCGLVAGAEVGFCNTPDNCDLIAQTGCEASAGTACYPSSGGLSCLMAGTVALGEVCEFTNSCMGGAGCIGPTGEDPRCRQWCDMSVTDPPPCPTDFACTGVTGLAPVGACTPVAP